MLKKNQVERDPILFCRAAWELGFELPPFYFPYALKTALKLNPIVNTHFWLQMQSPIWKNYTKSPPLVLKTQHYSTLPLFFSLAKSLRNAFSKLANREEQKTAIQLQQLLLKNELCRRKKKDYCPLTFHTIMLCYINCSRDSVSLFSTFRIHKQLPLPEHLPYCTSNVKRQTLSSGRVVFLDIN